MKKNNIPDLRFPQFNEPWAVKKLGEVCERIVGGGTPQRDVPQYWGEDIAWATVKDITDFNQYKTQEYISHEGLKQSSSNLIEKGILIMPTRILLGKSVIYNIPVAINQDLKALYFTNNISVKYIYFWVAQNCRTFEELGSGSTVKGISLPDLKRIPISLPSLPEQQKIADFLSGVDEKIGQLERRLALEEQYKKGMMQRLFDQEIRFKDENGNEFPDWEEKKLGEVGCISAGGDISSENVSQTYSDEYRYPIYANSDKNKGLYGYSNIYKQEGNCVTITGRGNIGIAVARFDKFYPIVRLLVLNPNYGYDVKCLEYVINRLNIPNESTGVPQLTGPQLSSVPISLPSLPEQQKIADFLSSLDDKIGQTKAELEKARDWKRGLMQRMFV